MKIKVPVKSLEREDVCAKVEAKLAQDPENAYTVSGMMVEVFGVKESDIENKPFSAWKKGLPTLYGRIDRCLKKLKEAGKVNCKKHERAWVYWHKVPMYNVKVKDLE